MSVRCVGRGLYEVKLPGDPHTFSVMVLGEQACNCDFYRQRFQAAEREADPMKKPVVSCPHIVAAANEYNSTSRRDRQQPGYYQGLEQKHTFENAKDDLLHMLEEMDE